jgi:hypothetical protein
MSLSKKEQDHLEVALSNRAVKEKILDELQAMRDAFNALLAKMDLDFADVTNAETDYEATLEIEPIREGDKKTRL